MARILGINGIRSDGATNTDALLHELAKLGWGVDDVDYPRVNALQYYVRGRQWHRRRQYRDAEPLITAHRPGDAVIAHSYGGLLTLRAMERGAAFSVAFLFAPALDRDVVFPLFGANHIHVIHNRRDKALCYTKLLRFHDSGAMGQHGYRGPPDDRVHNREAQDVTGERLHHSDYFLPQNIERWALWCDARLFAAGLRHEGRSAQ